MPATCPLLTVTSAAYLLSVSPHSRVATSHLLQFVGAPTAFSTVLLVPALVVLFQTVTDESESVFAIVLF